MNLYQIAKLYERTNNQPMDIMMMLYGLHLVFGMDMKKLYYKEIIAFVDRLEKLGALTKVDKNKYILTHY